MSEEIVKLSTSRFGDIDVPAASEIKIVSGIIGFGGLTRFTLLDYTAPFSWLQSMENGELAFVVVNAAEFGDEYRFPIPYGDKDIDLMEGDEVAIMNVVTVRPDPLQTTVNLKAPVVVNLKNRLGKQIILDDPRFPIRMQLWVKDEEKA